MSATPIPRTLEMAVTGIREMSTLATPPEERHPILTYVGPYDERQVGAAIRRELLREGQVFFVHNRVSDIERTAAHLQSLVPEARIRVAHGQMGEHDLEQTVVDFWERRFDVLVCTTIVETGLDIANANTLILDNADKFGLSQLHQLRGRVGRGRERAYAYFMWSPGATLTDTAHDRLSTIAANTELGAGMQVAMKDLEIRGAGNLLGGEQSGHIEGVGFDLYLRMVAEAVTDYRRGLDGDAEPEQVDTTLDLPVDAYLPHDYVPAERLRLEAYRRLAAATDDAAVDAVAEDLRDRFGAGPDGQLPPQVSSLLDIARLRVFLRGYGLSDVSVQGKFLRLAPVDLPESARLRLERLYPKTVVKPSLGTVLVPLPTAPQAGRPIGGPVGDAELVAWVRTLVQTVLPAPAAPVVVPATDPAAPSPPSPSARAPGRAARTAASAPYPSVPSTSPPPKGCHDDDPPHQQQARRRAQRSSSPGPSAAALGLGACSALGDPSAAALIDGEVVVTQADVATVVAELPLEVSGGQPAPASQVLTFLAVEQTVRDLAVETETGVDRRGRRPGLPRLGRRGGRPRAGDLLRRHAAAHRDQPHARPDRAGPGRRRAGPGAHRGRPRAGWRSTPATARCAEDEQQLVQPVQHPWLTGADA